MKHIKLFERFINEGIFSKNLDKNSRRKLESDILKIQGSDLDQRPTDSREIYTEEELSSMSEDEIMKLCRIIQHPRGRRW